MDEEPIEGKDPDDSYQVTDAGVLRLISKVKGETGTVVTSEFAPAAWSTVRGTRFDGQLSGKPGSSGKYVNGGVRFSE